MKSNRQSLYRNPQPRRCASRDFPTIVSNSFSSSGSATWKRGTPFRHGPVGAVPAKSIRVPVTPENRRYLRALRQAEMAQWDRPSKQTHPQEVSQPMPLGLQETNSRAEKLAFTLLTVVALASVLYVVLDAAYLIDRCSALVQSVWIAVH
jgi:hypothetical protein